jgi:hypothetical protein
MRPGALHHHQSIITINSFYTSFPVGGGGGPKWQGKVVEWGKGEVEALRKLVEEP